MVAVVSFLSDAALSDGCVGHTSALVRELELHGFKVHVVCLSSTGQNRVGGVLEYAGPVTMFGMLRSAIRSLTAALKLRADVLVCTSLGAPFNPLIVGVARICRIPVLYDCQDPPIETIPLIFGDSVGARILKAWVAFGDVLLRGGVSWAFTVSLGVEQLLRKHRWRMPIFRFYNSHSARAAVAASSTARIRELLGWQGALVLMYAGGLQPGIRGIELQLEAVALARRRGKNVKFLALGAGDAETFRALSSQLGIEEHVCFHHPVPRSELLSELRSADVAVVSTVPFALPSKVFEYVACGVRVLCDRRNTDVVEAFGNYVVPFDGTAVGLADALLGLHEKSAASDEGPALERFFAQNAASVDAVCRDLAAQGHCL